MKQQTVIRIGHSAYSGINALSIANSKAAAVRELRARGVLRNTARDAVNNVCKRIDGYKVIETAAFGVIELYNGSVQA